MIKKKSRYINHKYFEVKKLVIWRFPGNGLLIYGMYLHRIMGNSHENVWEPIRHFLLFLRNLS